MNWKGFKSEKNRASFAAGLAPVLHTASACTWPLTLMLAMLAWAVSSCARSREESTVLRVLRELWNTVAAVSVLEWMINYWPIFPDYAVAVAAVSLSLWIGSKPAGAAARGWAVAFYFVSALLAGVMVSALGDITADHLLPPFETGSGWLAALGLVMAFRFGCGRATWTVAPISSFVTLGVLGTAGAVPFYNLSRSIRFLAVAPRFESICACAMTMSFLIGLSTLIRCDDDAAPKGWTIAVKSAWTLALWYLRAEAAPSVLCITGLLLWAVPALLGNRIVLHGGENGKK